MTKPVRTAIFPVAGMGTRFLPATKATPKELLPVIDKPLIQYAIDEAREAGIERMIFVSHPSKSAIERYVMDDAALRAQLEARGKPRLAESLEEAAFCEEEDDASSPCNRNLWGWAMLYYAQESTCCPARWPLFCRTI